MISFEILFEKFFYITSMNIVANQNILNSKYAAVLRFANHDMQKYNLPYILYPV